MFQSINAAEWNLDFRLQIASYLVHLYRSECLCVGTVWGCRGCAESRISDVLLVVLPSAAFLWEAVLSECVREVSKG